MELSTLKLCDDVYSGRASQAVNVGHKLFAKGEMYTGEEAEWGVRPTLVATSTPGVMACCWYSVIVMYCCITITSLRYMAATTIAHRHPAGDSTMVL